MRNISDSENYGFDTIICDLVLQVTLSHILPLRVLEVHPNGTRGTIIHITEPKIHISYSKNHDSTLFFHYFYMPPLPTLTNTIAKGSIFSIISPFNVTKLQKKNCLDVSSTGSFPFPISMDTHIHTLNTSIAMGTQLGFQWHRESHSLSRKL